MSVQPVRVQNRWQGAAVVLVITLLSALAVVLTAHGLSEVRAQRAAREAAANAVAPVSEALRTAMAKGADGTAPGGKQVALTRAPAGISSDTATRARDSGVPVLDDMNGGVVVVATYDTQTPETVAGRRAHVTGLRVVPLDLRRTLTRLRPDGGGIAVAGPEQTVLSVPGARPSGRASYAVKLAPGPAPDWTLLLWAGPASIPGATWLTALGVVLVGAAAAGWLLRRDDRSRRSQQELVRLQETSATTAALATVAQQSLDLADLLPALTTELAGALGLQGLSLGAPRADGERRFFSWGATPPAVPASVSLPAELPAGETLCLLLARGGRTVASLRVLAGRDLDTQDLDVLGAATEVLTSALSNAEAFAQQSDLLQRLRSVDELKTVFLATASHELRTPVGVIAGYAQLLATSWDSLSSEEARMYAEQVDSNARRLGGLVEDLLDFSRIERGIGLGAAEGELDLGETVARILAEQPDLAPDHHVVHQAASGLAVTGSVQAVERVVTNLVGNAQKYSPAGTTIRVSVRAKRGRAELVVDDEGPGVPPAEREHVFSRFFRGRGATVVATRGAGLGLAIVSEFAATMGGQVSVTSAASGGARFVVSYPLAGPSLIGTEGAADVHP
jgi:signal transduction histidine kinase